MAMKVRRRVKKRPDRHKAFAESMRKLLKEQERREEEEAEEEESFDLDELTKELDAKFEELFGSFTDDDDEDEDA